MLRRHPADELRNVLDTGRPTFVLVDPLLGEPVAVAQKTEGNSARREAAWHRDIVSLKLPASIVLSLSLHPYLVCLNGPDDEWIDATLELARREQAATRREGLSGSGRGAYCIGGWLQSELEPVTLAQMLAECMRLRATMARATYLRLADRRTLDWLTVVLGEQALVSALSFVDRWVWLDANSALTELTPTTTERTDALHMSAPQWAEFSLASLVHPCLARWLGHGPRPGAFGITATETLVCVRDAVKNARREQAQRPAMLLGNDDVIAWAAMSLLRPNFERSPDFAAALARMTADDVCTFNTLCLALCGDAQPTTAATP